jgi:hypothetical protein
LRNRGDINGRMRFGEPSNDDRDRTDIGWLQRQDGLIGGWRSAISIEPV